MSFKLYEHFATVLLISILTLLLSSCGFQRQRPLVLAPPLQKIYLKTPAPYGPLAHNLQVYFKISGIPLVNSPENATTILEILDEVETQELLSVSSSQQTRQYNLITNVKFRITNPKGQILVGEQSVNEVRTLTTESNQILGGSNEAHSLYQQMWQAIVFDIADRLSSEEVSQLVTKNAAPTLDTK